MTPNMEIERKYLIWMPTAEQLNGLRDGQIWHILQTYLTDGPEGETRRVRSVEEKGRYTFYHTVKRRMGDITHAEYEREISEKEYCALLLQADPDSRPIVKTRYRFAYCGHTPEIDIYTFWTDRATLEIELQSEDEEAPIPDWIRIIRDVSREKQYKNRSLARQVPMEELK